jgi:uncharacterized membrane protein
MQTKTLYLLIKILASAGIVLACFLLWEQLFHPAFQPCRINSTVNCDAVISGAVSKTLGIPTPLYGLLGYIIIMTSAYLRKKKLLLGMATFGLFFCGWIAYKELFQLHVICPICIACDVIILSVFIISFIIYKRVVSIV